MLNDIFGSLIALRNLFSIIINQQYKMVISIQLQELLLIFLNKMISNHSIMFILRFSLHRITKNKINNTSKVV